MATSPLGPADFVYPDVPAMVYLVAMSVVVDSEWSRDQTPHGSDDGSFFEVERCRFHVERIVTFVVDPADPRS